MGGTPEVQVGYFKDVRLNPATGEIRYTDYFGKGLDAKSFILKKPSVPGFADVTLMKPEVESLTIGARNVFPSGYYYQLGGRTIKITQQTFSPYPTPIPITTPGGEPVIDSFSSTIGSSYIELPVTSYAFVSSSSKVSYPSKPSSIISSAYSSISKPSSVSKSFSSPSSSSISYPSIPSYSAPSYPSKPSYPSYPSYTYTPPKTPIVPPPTIILPPFRLKGYKPRRVRSKAPKGIVRREPSLWALGEKIYAPTKGQFEESGLGLRAIIIPGLTKKKRRKKRK